MFRQITQSETTFSKGLAQVFKEEVALIKKCVGRASSTAHSYFRPPSFRGTDLRRRKCGKTSAPHHLAVRRRGREWPTVIAHFYCLANILGASVEYTELTLVKLPVVLQTIELSDVAHAHCEFSIQHYDTTNNIFILKNKLHPVFNNNHSLRLYRVN